MQVLIHPGDLPYAKLHSVPEEWLLCWQQQIREQHGGLRKFSAFELYELIHGLYSACSVTLQAAEAAVLEHLRMWRADWEDGEWFPCEGCSSKACEYAMACAVPTAATGTRPARGTLDLL